MTKNHDPSSKWYTVSLLSLFASVGVFGYLALRHFELTFGHGSGESMCNINAVFNCDAVAASSYSEFLGIPLAIWGFSSNLILLFMALFYRWIWKDGNEILGRAVFLLALLNVLASIVMGTISMTQLSVYCPFCIATYILSIATILGFLQSIPAPKLHFAGDLPAYFSKNRSILVYFALIPVSAWLFSGMAHQKYQTSKKDIERMISFQLSSWASEKVNDFSDVNGLEYGASKENAKMTIVEFADFRCGHCKAAAPKLHAFTTSNPGVRLVFYNFPLDGECNSAITRKNGISCQLAKASVCGKDRAWDIHKWIFDHQLEFGSLTMTDEKLKTMATELKISHEELTTCMKSPETEELVKAQAKKGEDVGVKGTPSIYVNGKHTQLGQQIPILKALYDTL